MTRSLTANAFDGRATAIFLWSFQTGSIHINPVTSSVNGKQYIAVPTVWGGCVEGYALEMDGAPRGIAGRVRLAIAGGVRQPS